MISNERSLDPMTKGHCAGRKTETPFDCLVAIVLFQFIRARRPLLREQQTNRTLPPTSPSCVADYTLKVVGSFQNSYVGVVARMG